MSYSELLPTLIQKSLVFPKKLKSMVYPFLPVYGQNVRCEFHGGSSGHTTKDCKTLKYKVKELINNKVLTFRRNGSRMDISKNKLWDAQSREANTLIPTHSKEIN